MSACSVAVRPSRILAGVLAALHASALAAALASLSGVPMVLTCFGIVLCAVGVLAEALGLLPSSVRSLELQEDGSGMWRERSGRQYPVQSTRASWVSGGLVVLGLRTGRWRMRWIVLMPDSAPAESLRRLRVWLRWRAA